MIALRFSPIDALLLLMALIWGANYSIVKGALSEISPHAFNVVRMTIASSIFLIILAVRRRVAGRAPQGRLAAIFDSSAPISRADWVGLVVLGLVGHCLYQYVFINGLARTSVANSSLMLAATPVLIAVISAASGGDRIGRLHWAGAALSIAGIYAVVGRGVHVTGESLAGDLLMAAAVCCWAGYTIGAGRLMARLSPVAVTGLSMAIGSVFYVLVTIGDVRRVDWPSLSGRTWVAMIYSAIFAFCIAYTIWYAAVREIGSARTSVYSNLVPLVAMATAVVLLGEPLGARHVLGAAAVLSGVALTRVGRTTLTIPAEE